MIQTSAERPIDPRQVATAHDEMAAEYDQMDDLWYPWLFSRIHGFVVARLPEVRRTNRAVDAGCGTGLQSFLLAQAGFDTVGFDIAERLLEVARGKTSRFAVPPLEAPPLFASIAGGAWLERSHRELARATDRIRAERCVRPPTFVSGDLMTFDFGKDLAVITCCGSVLSFVTDYAQALARMAQALTGEGLLFLEVEQKRNLDLVWPAVDRALGGRLEYQQEWDEIASNLLARPGRSVRVDYPFELHDGKQVVLPIWLFSVRELERLFAELGLRVVARLGIHHLTNLVPSTLLHESPPPAVARMLFEPLRRLDGALGGLWPFWRLGCSVVYCLERRTAP